MSPLSIIGLLVAAPSVSAAAWSVLQARFSAVSIGLGFHDAQTGWTTFTDGSSAPKIVKTEDGGKSFSPVNSSGTVVLPTGFAASHGGVLKHVGSVGLLANDYSLDGDNFKTSLSPVIVSQSIKYEADRFIVAAPSGAACHSTEGAVFFCSSKAPLLNNGTGRYVSSPSKDVIYLTAGSWPSQARTQPANSYALSRNVRIRHSDGWMQARFEPVGAAPTPVKGGGNTSDQYTAELWKSTDGGKTWTCLLHDKGAFYFNDIHCYDEVTCVAVGEGFSHDGSTSPGARVYVTTDGTTFTLKHQEADGSSLMAAKMLSKTEHWAGGSSKAGGLTAPVLALHSTDGGESWANDPSATHVPGQMITAFDFVDGVGYATTVNALQVSSILKYA